MGYRKTGKRKRTYTAPRYRRTKGKTSFRRGVISTNKSLHYFKRKTVGKWVFNLTTGDLPASTTDVANVYLSSDIRLSYMSNYADFTGLFDLYRINAVKVSMFYGYNVSNRADADNSAAGKLTLGVPSLTIVSDPDDSAAPTSMAELLERPYSKTFLLEQKRSFYFKPVVDREGYDGTNSYNYVQKGQSRPYIDMNKPDIIHNGIKMALRIPFENMDTVAKSLAIEIPIVTTFYLEFKDPR